MRTEPAAGGRRFPRRFAPAWILLSIALILPAAGAGDEGFDGRLYRNGISLLRAGQPEHALETFAELTREFPNSPYADDALYQSGAYYYPPVGLDDLYRIDRQSIARAIPFFLKIQEEYARNDMAPMALYKLGLIALEARNPDRNLDEAFARFSRLLTLYPDSPVMARALLGTAHVQAAMGDCDRAMIHLDRLMARYPDSPVIPQGLFLMAVCQAEAGQDVPALETLQDLADRAGDGADASRARRFLTLIYRTRFLPSVGLDAPMRRDEAFGTATARAGVRSCDALAVDGAGRIYVADSRQDSLWSFQADGTLIGRAERPAGIGWIGIRGERGVLTGGRDSVHLRDGPRRLSVGGKVLEDLESVAISTAGTIYVGDRKRPGIPVFDEDLNSVGDLPPPEDGDLVGLRIGPRSELHALYDQPVALYRLGRDGRWTAIPLGEEVSAARPVDFAVDGLGNLYLLSRRGGPVLILDRAGTPLRRLDPAAGGAEPRLEATSIAVGPTGGIVLCTRKGDRIVRFH